jgi:hypothetical protein
MEGGGRPLSTMSLRSSSIFSPRSDASFDSSYFRNASLNDHSATSFHSDSSFKSDVSSSNKSLRLYELHEGTRKQVLESLRHIQTDFVVGIGDAYIRHVVPTLQWSVDPFSCSEKLHDRDLNHSQTTYANVCQKRSELGHGNIFNG